MHIFVPRLSIARILRVGVSVREEMPYAGDS